MALISSCRVAFETVSFRSRPSFTAGVRRNEAILQGSVQHRPEYRLNFRTVHFEDPRAIYPQGAA
jgi:hypothetical protein